MELPFREEERANNRGLSKDKCEIEYSNSTDSGKSLDSGYKSHKREKTPDDVDEVKTEYKEFIIPRWNKVSSVCKH